MLDKYPNYDKYPDGLKAEIHDVELESLFNGSVFALAIILLLAAIVCYIVRRKLMDSAVGDQGIKYSYAGIMLMIVGFGFLLLSFNPILFFLYGLGASVFFYKADMGGWSLGSFMAAFILTFAGI